MPAWLLNTQNNDTQHNDTRHNDIQHNDAKYNDTNTQHCNKNVQFLIFNCFAECHYAKSHCTDCRGANWWGGQASIWPVNHAKRFVKFKYQKVDKAINKNVGYCSNRFKPGNTQ